jgi:hypothetical protein
LWIGDFAEDNDKEHSDQYWWLECSYNCTTKTRHEKDSPLKWILTLYFTHLEEFSSPNGMVHNYPVWNDDKDYFSVFTDDNFHNLKAEETN